MINLIRQYANLPPEKRDLFKRLLRKQGIDPDSLILPQERCGDAFPLSFAQQRLWFLDQLEPGSPLYNIPSAVHLKGELDLAVLKRCLDELVHRHEPLRTIFINHSGEAVQVICPEIELPFRLVDLTGLPAECRETEALRIAHEEVLQPFVLSALPLIRITLFRLRVDEHIALLVAHHIISDGWSMDVIMRELVGLYADFTGGNHLPLPVLPVQYGDYAVWQRNWLRGERLTAQINYWKEQLAGLPKPLELPLDHPRPPVQTYPGEALPFEIAGESNALFANLCRQNNVTLFMGYLVVLQILLYRYTGQDDFCIGTPVANRTREEVEGLIGFFVNTLALRATVTAEMNFESLGARVKETLLGASAHQDLPFETLVDAIQPERDPSRSPIFQVMYALQNQPAASLDLAGLVFSPIALHTETAKFDLSFILSEEASGISGVIEFNTDLFERGTIQRMAAHFSMLVESILHDPSLPISDLEMIPVEEKRRLLVNPIPAPEIDAPSIHALFERAALADPQRIALVCGEQSLTYAGLDGISSHLAQALVARGVQPDTPVGLYTNRSASMIVGLLGILRTGAAYLPLDAHYPAERIAYICQNAGLRTVLVEPGLTFPIEDAALDILPIPVSTNLTDPERPEIPLPGANPHHLAYILYTSGSTGRPKGVMIEHHSVLNLLAAFHQAAPTRSQPNGISACPFGFDVSAWEFFSALCYGGTLHILQPETIADPKALAWYILEHQITSAYIPPAILTDLATELERSALPIPLERILVGVEPIKQSTLQRYLDLNPQMHIINGYGPTETTICATFYPFTGAVDPERRTPIGAAIAGYSVHIVDKNLKLVPTGVSGEIIIGGAGLARGYLNAPELTAQAFIPHPLSTHPNERVYRTGDLARRLPDGNIEFIGRADHQVKIRGFRVEPGEVEMLLSKHPAVAEVVVLARDDPHSSTDAPLKYLAAYIIPVQDASISQDELRAFLKTRLPEYMLPSVFVFLQAFPQTANGKLDRKALPEPALSASAQPTGDRIRLTPTEEILAGIWAQVLGIPVSSPQADFFDIGGHSLLATRLLSRIRDTFQVELPLREIFNEHTLSGMADAIQKAMQVQSGLVQQKIPLAPRSVEVPLSFSQQRLWFLDQFEPGSSLYNIPVAVRLSGKLDLQALEDSLNGVIQRHETLRTSFQSTAGRPFQIIEAEQSIHLNLIDLTGVPENDIEEGVRSTILEISRHPFDLTRGPLLRASILKISTENHIAVLVMHHIISDGWSAGILIREMAQLYTAILNRATSMLPVLPVQYADFAIWQREQLSGDALQAQMDFWKKQLEDVPLQLDLPTDRPRPAVQTSNGTHLSFDLSEEITISLRALCQKEGVTLFMGLLAALQMLLYRYTAQTDFCIGSPVANRGRSEIEGLIGFFVNTLVLRADLSNHPSFHQLLARVRETCLGAYAHQEVPFEKLVDAIQPERSTSRNPLFQVMFVLQNAERAALSLPGLSLQPLDLDTHLAMFDLSLILEDSSSSLSGGFEFNTDLFDTATIAQLARHFSALLSAALASPDSPVSSLPFLSPSELDTLLHTWNDTQVDWPQLFSTFHALFELQAARSPHAIAACSIADGSSLSFAQLNAQSNRLARHLRSLGAAPDACVALCLERSLLLPVALLAVLKAGAAFLPLDPAFPPERTSLMLSETQTAILLTSSSLASALPESGCTVLCLDDLLPQLASLDPSDLPPLSSPDHLAYVLYTSGSTGTPKGVLVDNRSMLNHNLAAAALFDLSPADRVLQFASLTFDTAVEEFFPAWLCGASVFLRPPGALPDAASLLAWVERFSLSVLDLPTAFWHEWAAELPLLPLPLPPCLRLVVVGGEKALPERLAAWLSAVGPRPAWLNTYGPTEGTIIASSFSPPPSFSPSSSLPIGRPIPNVRLYVLDPLLQPVPPRVPGELCIAGLGVARGYLLRPELSAQRFLQDPFCPSQRLFRTGDRARFLPDGSLEFLGRFDDQLKLRGFRIEPGEVVSALLAHPALSQAAVLPCEFAPGQLRLVAYLVALPGTEQPSVEDLKAFLRSRLPEFMLPSAFLFLPALPLTSSGKLDRRALPAPSFSSSPSPSSSADAPLSPTEAALAAIWQQVLGLPSVSRFDNFFALGGDSILSIQVVARANQAGFHLSPRLLFEHPSLADLAAALAAAPALAPVDQSPASGPYPLSPIQSWFFDLALPSPHHWNQSLLLALPRRLDPGALHSLSLALLAHHDVLRSSFSRSESAWQASIAPAPRPLPIPCEDLSALVPAAQDAALLAALEVCQARFDLEAFDLFQLAFFWLGPLRGGRLFLAAHHLVVDGLSWRILLEDLHAALSSLDAGLPIRLPPRSASFPAWSARLAQLAASPAILDTLPFWLALAAIPPAPLPALPSAPLHAPESSALSLSLSLSPADTRRFLADAPTALHAEPLSLLLAALAQALLAWAGPGFFPIELEGHGREDLPDPLDLSRSAGWFTALFPFPLDLRAAPSPAASLAQVKSSLRSLPLHGLPFSLLLAHPPSPQVGEQLRQAAFPSISFNYLGQWDAAFPQAALFSLAEEPRGFERDPAAPRSHPLILSAAVIHAALHFEISFSPVQFSPTSVQALLDAFRSALLALLDLRPELLSLNPLDFPLANLDQKKLDRILNKVNQSRRKVNG